MTSLNPKVPFVWPDPRVILGKCEYQKDPPYADLASSSGSIFGIVTSPKMNGIHLLEKWMAENLDLKVRLMVLVYPTCETRQEDLEELLQAVQDYTPRLQVHLQPLKTVTSRATNSLCFLPLRSDKVQMVTGVSENFGLCSEGSSHGNLAFSANAVLIDSFREYFEWLWASSPEITADGVTNIPFLVLPEGTEEGARLWREYLKTCSDLNTAHGNALVVAELHSETGELTLKDCQGREVKSATEEIGLKKMDPLAIKTASLFEKGRLVSIDKYSRIPPLDAPLDPRLFGDAAELQTGNVTRRVSMRISVIDEKTLAAIERRRGGVRNLLNKFTFALGDSMRWMPEGAQPVFEQEIQKVNSEGQAIIANLLAGNSGAFLESRRGKLEADIKGMLEAMGREGKMSDAIVERVIVDLQSRLEKAQSGNFAPKLTYSFLQWSPAENIVASPWGQAFVFLRDIALFPRKVLSDSFFLKGVKVDEDRLLDAMDIANDAICVSRRERGTRERCKREIEMLTAIEESTLESRDRCELVWQIIAGKPEVAIREVLEKEKEE